MFSDHCFAENCWTACEETGLCCSAGALDKAGSSQRTKRKKKDSTEPNWIMTYLEYTDNHTDTESINY